MLYCLVLYFQNLENTLHLQKYLRCHILTSSANQVYRALYKFYLIHRSKNYRQ